MKSKKRTEKRKKVIIPITKGKLSSHGYSTKKSALARHRSINKALRTEPSLEIARGLYARATLLKNRGPAASAVFREDAQWVMKKSKHARRRRTRKK